MNRLRIAKAKKGIRERLYRYGEMMMSEITQSFSGRIPSKILREALKELIDEGIVIETRYQPPGGGRPGRRYELR